VDCHSLVVRRGGVKLEQKRQTGVSRGLAKDLLCGGAQIILDIGSREVGMIVFCGD